MKMKVTHPSREFVEFELNHFAQIVGGNQELKYYIFQLINWYFNGKKYSEDDLEIFDFNEPTITINQHILSRKKYRVVSIETMSDIAEQLSLKKGTLAFDYICQIMSQVDLAIQIEKMNDVLQKMICNINDAIKIEEDSIRYETDAIEFIKETIIKAHLQSKFHQMNKSISVDLLNNSSKLNLLISILEKILTVSTEHYLLVLRNLGNSISRKELKIIKKRLLNLTEHHKNLSVIHFIGYHEPVIFEKEVVEEITIIGERIASLPELEFLYHRFIQSYPLSTVPTMVEFCSSLERIVYYLFDKEWGEISLSIKDQTTLKVLHQLYDYDLKEVSYISNSKVLQMFIHEDD